MRRPNRNIEIFSMSVLDLFASALGGFIMIAVILFPYYLKNDEAKTALEQKTNELARREDELRQKEAALASANAELGQCQALDAQKERQIADLSSQLQQSANVAGQVQRLQSELAAAQQGVTETTTLRQRLQSCEQALAQTFIVVSIEWPTAGADVDLHVIDPQGNEFDFAKNNRTRTNYPNSLAQLSYDNTRGPGVELWQHPQATPGTYKIIYVLFSAPSGGSPVEVKGNVFYRNGRKQLPVTTLTGRGSRKEVATIVVGGNGTVEVR